MAFFETEEGLRLSSHTSWSIFLTETYTVLIHCFLILGGSITPYSDSIYIALCSFSEVIGE